jgi:hypothetical protein
VAGDHERQPGVLPRAGKNYVLVASEWYLASDGLNSPAKFNMDKAHARQPDWMTFTGWRSPAPHEPRARRIRPARPRRTRLSLENRAVVPEAV